MTKSKKNPLFVVTDKGSVVEEASGVIDALIKKLGVQKLIDVLSLILKSIFEQVKTAAALGAASLLLEKVLELLQAYWPNAGQRA